MHHIYGLFYIVRITLISNGVIRCVRHIIKKPFHSLCGLLSIIHKQKNNTRYVVHTTCKKGIIKHDINIVVNVLTLCLIHYFE